MTGPADAALLSLLQSLRERGYHFVTITPASHARVVARLDMQRARDLRGMLGWSLPFRSGMEPGIEDLLRQAHTIENAGTGMFKSKLRVSSLGDLLFLHSAYPTEAEDAVFLGPDSYRFAELIRSELAIEPLPAAAHIVDMGTGAGVGGIVAGLGGAGTKVTLTDVNPKALRLAAINATAAGLNVETLETADLDGVPDPIDLIVINPPYIIDHANRT